MASLCTNVSEMRAEVGKLGGTVAGLQSTVQTLDTKVNSNSERLNTLEEDFKSFKSQVSAGSVPMACATNDPKKGSSKDAQYPPKRDRKTIFF